MNPYFLPILAGILVAVGQFLMKKGLGTISMNVSGVRLIAQFFFSALTNVVVLSAIVLLVSGSLTYMISLRNLIFTRTVPITASVVLTCSILLGWTFLNENLSYFQIIGLVLIMIGIAFLVVISE